MHIIFLSKVSKVSVKAAIFFIVMLSLHEKSVIHKNKLLDNWIQQFISFQIIVRLINNYRMDIQEREILF